MRTDSTDRFAHKMLLPQTMRPLMVTHRSSDIQDDGESDDEEANRDTRRLSGYLEM